MRDYYRRRREADPKYKDKPDDRARARKYHKAWHTSPRLSEPERIERRCLKCDRKFMAWGRFNRVCPACTKLNEDCWDPFIYGIPMRQGG